MRCKITTNFWNIQGFEEKNANLFVFYAAKPCCSHKRADVSSKGSPQGEVVEITTNIWNVQVFNEENANLFVILFIKGLLVRTNVRNNRSSLWRDKNVSSRWATLTKSVGVLEIKHSTEYYIPIAVN